MQGSVLLPVFVYAGSGLTRGGPGRVYVERSRSCSQPLGQDVRIHPRQTVRFVQLQVTSSFVTVEQFRASQVLQNTDGSLDGLVYFMP